MIKVRFIASYEVYLLRFIIVFFACFFSQFEIIIHFGFPCYQFSKNIFFDCLNNFWHFYYGEIVFQFNQTFATTKHDNPVISWNKFPTNITQKHNLSSPKLARTYALVHISS